VELFLDDEAGLLLEGEADIPSDKPVQKPSLSDPAATAATAAAPSNMAPTVFSAEKSFFVCLFLL